MPRAPKSTRHHPKAAPLARQVGQAAGAARRGRRRHAGDQALGRAGLRRGAAGAVPARDRPSTLPALRNIGPPSRSIDDMTASPQRHPGQAARALRARARGAGPAADDRRAIRWCRAACRSSSRTGRRAPRRARAASPSSWCRSTSPRATSPPPSPSWSRASSQHERNQVLLGVTGSGKTFTAAQVISRTQRPALVLAPNKTLAAQLYGEFKSFFPDNAVEYFVSYYDYYQPEAYVPRTDTYIEKESSVNEQIDRMRHAATRSLLERDDVIIVRRVSCIYGIGSVETYTAMTFTVQTGETLSQRQLLADLVALHYRRSDANFIRGTFRVRGDTVELFPAHLEDRAWRISLFGDEVESHHRVRSAHRPQDRRAEAHQGLLQLALRHAQADAAAGHQVHQGRAQAAPRGTVQLRPPAGGAAPRAAHRVRHGDDGGDRLLRRHRELLALSHRPPARRAAADPVRVPARQRAGVRRREPRHRAADRRHVPRRLPAQGDARRIRLPPALLHGQPPAALRGVGRHAAADHLRLGHARRLGAGADRRQPSPSR